LGSAKLFNRILGIFSLLFVLSCGQKVMPQTRIAEAIRNDQRVTLSRTTSPLIAKSVETGRLPGGQNLGRMLLLLAPSVEQEQAATQFVNDLHDGSSPSFHQWLSPADFGKRFGIADADAAQVQQWLQSRGLTVHEISQSRRFIVFSGSVSQVENAFATEMHSYSYKQGEKELSFISNSTDMQIPAALQAVVKGVVRLHSDPRSSGQVVGGKVHFNRTTRQFTASSGDHLLAPADFAKIYNVQPLYDAGIDGTGQNIAIVGRSQIDVQNVRDFRTILGLPANDPEIILNGDDPGQTQNDMPEALLDVTWSGAVAPMAHIQFVVSQSNFADGIDASAAYIVDHNLAPVMSTSYGTCEQTMTPVQNAFYNSLWQQAAAQGITSFVSAGDSGGAGCDPSTGGNYGTGLGINGIASTPYNVAVGGTQFDDTDNPSAYWSATSDPVTWLSALGYIPEKVWNESINDPYSSTLLAAGGGVSTLYTKPNWQTAAGVPNDGKRDIPDFSLSASVHDGYLVCLYGGCNYGEDYFYYFGGTSASSPAAAGIMALVNQKMGGQRQGVANFVFYRLAAIPGVYHDTTKGDNKVPDANGQFTLGYSAGTGYDLATGLGSFDASALVNNWSAAASALGTTTTLKLANGQSLPVIHGTPITFNASVQCSGTSCKHPTGEVSLLATSAAGDTAGPGTGQLTPGSPSTSNIKTATVPGGTYGVTGRYSGDGTYYSSTSSAVQVTVTPEPSQTYVGVLGGGSLVFSPVSISYDEPLQIAAIVAGNSGYGYPSGALTLQADGQPVQTVLPDGVTPSPMALNYGEKSTILFGGAPISQSSTISYLAPGIAVGTHQLQANYPGDNSFSSSTSPGSTTNTYSYTVIKAKSFIGDFFPMGTPVANVPVALAGQIGLQNYCAPYGGTVTATDLSSGTPVVLGSTTIAPDIYCDAYTIPVTFKTPGIADPQCTDGSACRHIVQISYSGDANVSASSQKYPYFYVSSNSPTNTMLSADTVATLVGSPVTLTASVFSNVPLRQPTGEMVTFMDGATTLGTAPLADPQNQGGGTYLFTATLVVSNLAGGPHSLIAKFAGDSVNTGSDSSATPVILNIMDYTLQGAPTAMTIKDGQSGVATISVFPLGGFAQPVQLSCGMLPANVSCHFSQASVTPDGVHPSNATLTINTSRVAASNNGNNRLWAVTSTFAFGFVLLPFVSRKRLKISLGMLGLFLVVLAGVGCGGGGSSSNNATAGTYSVTINAATAGAVSAKTAQVSVTIVH
jgi:Pro-kumamolisin, activation domain/Bacterial Ig-like domain (group 3)